MKKLFCFILPLILLLAFCACSEQSDIGDDPISETVGSPDTNPSTEDTTLPEDTTEAADTVAVSDTEPVSETAEDTADGGNIPGHHRCS